MEPTVPHKKLESGVFEGSPEISRVKTEDSSSPRVIRTMKSDTMEVSKKQNETFISIALSEETKSKKEQAPPQTHFENNAPVPKRIGRMVVVGALLLITLLSVLAYVFILPKLSDIKIPNISIPSFYKTPETATKPMAKEVIPLAQSIVPARSEKRFNLSTETFAEMVTAITRERGSGNSAGSIKNLYFFEEGVSATDPVSAGRLLAFAGISAPDILTRSLEKQFMVGFFGEKDGGATPFVIFKVSGYDTSFAGMLEWESGLPVFFDTIFGTNTTSNIHAKFSDGIIAEKNARILDVSYGDTIAYAFANPSTIIIAGTRTALEELVAVAGKN